MLDRNTKKNEMETSNENRITPRIKVDKKQQNGLLDSALEQRQTVGRQKKRWEDDINQFVKLGETEETRGSDLKHNDT